MSLPKVYSPMETVEIGGEQFTVRVLTRAEQFRIQKMIQDGAPEDELEIAAIAMAADTPADEVRAWYQQTGAWVVKELIGHVERISRLSEGAQKSGGTGDRPRGG